MKPPRLSAVARSHVQFARFCATHSIDPTAAAQLVTLANWCFRAGVREANGESAARADERLGWVRKRFEAAAAELRYRVQWPGLWPSLTTTDGHAVELPRMR